MEAVGFLSISLSECCNKVHGMCYPVCGVVHIEDPLLLVGKSSPCSGHSRFPLSLSQWSFTICPTPYNHIENKTFPSFLITVKGYTGILAVGVVRCSINSFKKGTEAGIY